MKLITFSLWGQDPKYLIGAIRNAELAKQIYPDWRCRFYVGQSVPSQIILRLESFDNVGVVRRPEFGDWRGMFWRFLPASEEGVDVIISRDTDSRLNTREKAAVDEWLASDQKLHIMRDHPHHGYPILGGMWGAKQGAIKNIEHLIDNFAQEDAYGTDYKFFAELIFPILKEDDVMIHDEFFGGQPFPVKRNGYEFVGQVFDEKEETVQEHIAALSRVLNEAL
tara:strand:+ start:502 stop:1170 length:669 start_codon:yes stop_codon:yes gene_type:complete